MATNNMHNMTTLIKRLEAATSRLEDIASSVTSLPNDRNNAATSTTQLNGTPIISVLSTPSVTPTPTTNAKAASPAPPEDLPKEIEDFDKIIDGELVTFMKLSEMDPALVELAAALKKTLQEERTILYIATKAKKPAEGSKEYISLYDGITKNMVAINDLQDKNKNIQLKNHMSLVADATQALTWIAIDNKPADYLGELFGGAQIWGDKILRAYKDKEPKHVAWVNAFYKIFTALKILVLAYYSPRGIKWVSDGISVPEALEKYKSSSTSASAAPAPLSGGPPPPPPPPSAAQILSAAGLSPVAPAPPPKAKGGDMGSVFAELSKGENVTAGLKKVDPSMQTHKNPTLRGTAPTTIARSDSQNSSKSVPPQKAPKPESMRTKKPPRKELDGTKWLVENYDSPSAPVEITAERNHSILITRCKNTTIRITGKANAISIDNCPKTSIILDSLVSALDVIKCPSFAVQVIDTLPTILLDQVDGASIYLSANSLQTEIMTSKCSSVNVYLPPAEESGDFEEVNVPEQFRSYVKDGKLVTEIVEHKG